MYKERDMEDKGEGKARFQDGVIGVWTVVGICGGCVVAALFSRGDSLIPALKVGFIAGAIVGALADLVVRHRRKKAAEIAPGEREDE